MALKIFNTFSGEKDEFIPLTPGRVRMYVCGVTVYDSAHLGHCRFLITFDVIYRYLRFLGFDVTYVRNFTEGRCLMRGLDGRVAAVRFDVVDPEFLRLVDTNPNAIHMEQIND